MPRQTGVRDMLFITWAIYMMRKTSRIDYNTSIKLVEFVKFALAPQGSQAHLYHFLILTGHQCCLCKNEMGARFSTMNSFQRMFV